MKVLDVMNKKVITVQKENTILNVIRIMKDKDIGFIIIAENDEAIGVVTDRDILLSLTKEISLDTPINKIMKKYVITIDENSDVSIASDMMGYMQVRRLVVVDGNNKICGVLSLSDLASNSRIEELALETLIEISYNYPTKNDKSDSILQVSAYIF